MAKAVKPSQRVINSTIKQWVAAKRKLSAAEKEVEALKKVFKGWTGNKPGEFVASDGTKVPIREKSRDGYTVAATTYLEVGLVKPKETAGTKSKTKAA